MGEFKMKNERAVQGPEIVNRTFRFAVMIVAFCAQLDQMPGVGRVLMSQIARSGTSVGSNVEEAQAAESRADFTSKRSVALKEARETNYRLRVMATARIPKIRPPAELVREADEIRRILGAIVASTRGTRRS
jgi:four helix bundle protein